MIHRSVEEKLNRRRKLFIAFPKDILKRYVRESVKDERSIPHLNRLPSGSDASFYE
jgi:hypothetical protein